MYIKEWKIKEIAREYNGGFLEEILGIERETEKAYLLCIAWDYTSDLYRTLKVWVPKSATMTDEEYREEQRKEDERFEEGCKRYENLVAFAKEHGIKGIRVGMRKNTILTKIAEAGLEYAY